MAKRGRPQAQAQAKVDTNAIMAKILSDVDARTLLAAMLGATAAAGGITPPLTMLLKAINNNLDATSAADVVKMLPVPVVSIPAQLWDIFMPQSTDTSSKSERTQMLGVMASGAMEGMIMMELVKNKELMRQVTDVVGKLGAATITAAGEAVPF